MSYFVTGATGFIGRFLVANLLRRKGTIHVLVRKDSQKRSEEHTSELQSLMRISYAVFCLKHKHFHRHDKHPTSLAKHHHTVTPRRPLNTTLRSTHAETLD